MISNEKLLRQKYETCMGRGGNRLLHWEYWSNPEGETSITGIDYFDHPKLCREKMAEMIPELDLPIPDTDAPLTRIEDQEDGGHGRWGAEMRENWQQDEAGSRFASEEEMLAFSPLENPDFSDWTLHGGVNQDFSSEEAIYERYRKDYPPEWGDTPPEGVFSSCRFYNTMFMWPLQVFGYESFMYICLDPAFDRVIEEFAEISRRVFKAFARLPVNFVVCHDDIVLTNGPVCSREWMHKHIFPRYEEFWGILKDAGKKVIHQCDGKLDAYVDDVIACGARGFLTEPYTDFKAIAVRHKDLFLSGEGDNRVLMRNNTEEIRKMVVDMAETAKMSRGYMMGIGNHLPFNVPGDAVLRYFEFSRELAYR